MVSQQNSLKEGVVWIIFEGISANDRREEVCPLRCSSLYQRLKRMSWNVMCCTERKIRRGGSHEVSNFRKRGFYLWKSIWCNDIITMSCVITKLTTDEGGPYQFPIRRCTLDIQIPLLVLTTEIMLVCDTASAVHVLLCNSYCTCHLCVSLHWSKTTW